MTLKPFSLTNLTIRAILACGLGVFAINSLPLLAAQAYTGTWTLTQPMQFARFGHTATMLVGGPDDGKILVAGGSLEVTLPETGGLTGSPVQPAETSDLPTGQTAELYNPAAPDAPWSLTAPLNTPRIFHTATLIAAGKVLVAGGGNTQTQASLNTAEIYDSTGGPGGTPIWTPTTNAMAHAHISATATLLDNGKVLIAGGYSGSIASGDATNTVEIFNPATNSWSSAPTMHHARAFHTATLIHPNGSTYGKVLVTGGSTAAVSGWGNTLASAELYDPAANTWTDVQPLLGARSDHSATLLEDGQLLVAGGNNPATGEDETYLASAEIYNPDANSWTATTPLSIARGNHTAILLENGPQNGKVLVAGGANSTSAVINTELFDPTTETWLDSGGILDPNGGRVSHTATLLANGQVLLTGGFLGIGNTADNSAELYMPIQNQTITIDQGAPAEAAYLSTFTVSASAPGGLVTYSSGNTGVCTVETAEDEKSATFTMQSGSNICPVQYDQTGNEDYAPAPQITQEVAAQKLNQTITVTQNAPSTAPYMTSFQVTATTSSGLGVVYSSGSPVLCSADQAGTFTMNKGTGICVVQFDQPGDPNYNPALQNTSNVTAEKISQSISFTASGPHPYGADFSVAAIANSKLSIAFSVDAQAPCSIASSEQDPNNPAVTNALIHPTDLGDCTITTAQEGDENYTPATSVSQTVSIVRGDQTITITRLAPSSAGFQTTFTVTASSSSGLAVTYSSTGVCSNTGNQFTMFSGTGICYVHFDQEGDSHFYPAPTITSAVNARKINQTINVTQSAPATATYQSTFTVAAMAPGGTVTYDTGSLEVCSVVGAQFTMLTGTGTCIVQFNQSGSDNYNPALQTIEYTTAVRATQEINVTIHTPTTATYNSHFTVAGVSDSGLEVTYSSGSPEVCSNIGSEFTVLTGTGNCIVQFNQDGDADYAPALEVTEYVAAAKVPQTISVTSHVPLTAAYKTTFSTSATSNSGLEVAFSSASPTVCTVEKIGHAAIFTMQKGTGTCLVQYDQAGDGNYQPALRLTEEVTAQKIGQSITFKPIDDVFTFEDPDLAISATSDSELAVSLSLGQNDPCTLSGDQLHIDHTGSCTITFSQPGDDNYDAAAPVSKQITILKKTISILLSSLTHKVDGHPKAVTVVPEVSGITVVITYSATDYGPTSLPPSKIGTYSVTAVINDQDYQGSATADLIISPVEIFLPIVIHP